MNFNSETNISISLQAKDWHFLAGLMRGSEVYEDLEFNLKTKFQIPNPPIGTTLVQADNQYLGIILRLFYSCHITNGKEIGKNVRNRFRNALEALSLQEITNFLIELDLQDITIENGIQETGRKWLRGKLG